MPFQMRLFDTLGFRLDLVDRYTPNLQPSGSIQGANVQAIPFQPLVPAFGDFLFGTRGLR